ncbi:MAG: DegV family protein [Firmicutes bacterium]|nr:DegV family protein [Bacillota bacterium]
MSKIIILAESGSDVTKEMAEKYNIEVVPMHVSFDDYTLDDGHFEPEKIVEFYQTTGKLPKTSGCMPDDFIPYFDRIHEENPDSKILYLAYSAVTTRSYQSAVIATEDRDYIHMIDTKHVSVGQGLIVVAVAKYVQENPDASIEEVIAYAEKMCEKARMCFMPDDLEFLRAGGRVSNVAFLGARILSLHPCIEVLDGKLVATKKFRGKMTKASAELIREYADKYDLGRKEIYIIYTVGLSDEVKKVIEDTVKECGFESCEWVLAHGVITTHGGPAAFGIAGFAR